MHSNRADRRFNPYVAAVLFFAAVGVAYAASNYTRLNNTLSVQLNPFGTCYIVTNNNGNDIFIPYNTSNEFSSFLNHLPPNVTVGPCVQHGQKIFTFYGGQWTIPAGVTMLTSVQVVSGGGGGGGGGGNVGHDSTCTTANDGGGGGGAGAYAQITNLPVTPGESFYVTVNGTGASGGTGPTWPAGNPGASGTTASFGEASSPYRSVSVSGGHGGAAGGYGASLACGSDHGGQGGVAAGPSVSFGVSSGPCTYSGGLTGSCTLGASGSAGATWGPGGAGGKLGFPGSYGDGGSGGQNGPGNAGNPGVIIVTW